MKAPFLLVCMARELAQRLLSMNNISNMYDSIANFYSKKLILILHWECLFSGAVLRKTSKLEKVLMENSFLFLIFRSFMVKTPSGTSWHAKKVEAERFLSSDSSDLILQCRKFSISELPCILCESDRRCIIWLICLRRGIHVSLASSMKHNRAGTFSW